MMCVAGEEIISEKGTQSNVTASPYSESIIIYNQPSAHIRLGTSFLTRSMNPTFILA